MSVCIFSDEFVSSYANSVTGSSILLRLNASGYSRFALYTAGNGLSVMSSITDRNDADSKATGRLWWTGTSASYTYNYNVIDVGIVEITSDSSYTASSSGVAAEFLWYSGGSPSQPAVVLGGTVTTPGGGGDMIIADTNIVSGESYKIVNWRIKFYESFTF